MPTICAFPPTHESKCGSSPASGAVLLFSLFPVGVQCCLIALICSSLMTYKVQHLFRCLLSISIASLRSVQTFESESHSVMSDSATPWTIQYSRLLYNSWNSLGQNTGGGSLLFSRGSSQSRDRTQVQTFGPLKMLLLLLSYWVLRILVYLWYESFITCFTNISSQSVACSFLLLTVSFKGRHFLILKSNISGFCFCLFLFFPWIVLFFINVKTVWRSFLNLDCLLLN